MLAHDNEPRLGDILKSFNFIIETATPAQGEQIDLDPGANDQHAKGKGSEVHQGQKQTEHQSAREKHNPEKRRADGKPELVE